MEQDCIRDLLAFPTTHLFLCFERGLLSDSLQSLPDPSSNVSALHLWIWQSWVKHEQFQLSFNYPNGMRHTESCHFTGAHIRLLPGWGEGAKDSAIEHAGWPPGSHPALAPCGLLSAKAQPASPPKCFLNYISLGWRWGDCQQVGEKTLWLKWTGIQSIQRDCVRKACVSNKGACGTAVDHAIQGVKAIEALIHPEVHRSTALRCIGQLRSRLGSRVVGYDGAEDRRKTQATLRDVELHFIIITRGPRKKCLSNFWAKPWRKLSLFISFPYFSSSLSPK